MRQFVPALTIVVAIALSPAVSGADATALRPGCTWDVPSPGFNPFTASSSQLAAEGDFPPRPAAGTKAETDWTNYANAYMAGEVPVCVGGTQNPLGIANTTPATTWGGWGVHNQSFTDADADFYVPSSVTGQNGDGASYWAGVNLAQNCVLYGTCAHPIVQGGVTTKIGVSGYAPCHMWWEVWPFNLEYDFSPPQTQDCWGNDTIYAHATLTSGGAISIHVVNETHYADDSAPSIDWSSDCGGACLDDGHAERVAEWNSYPGGLVHWSTPPWTDGVEFSESRAASPGTGWKYFNQLSNYTLNITDSNGAVLATPYPNGLGSVGDGPTWWVQRY